MQTSLQAADDRSAFVTKLCSMAATDKSQAADYVLQRFSGSVGPPVNLAREELWGDLIYESLLLVPQPAAIEVLSGATERLISKSQSIDAISDALETIVRLVPRAVGDTKSRAQLISLINKIEKHSSDLYSRPSIVCGIANLCVIAGHADSAGLAEMAEKTLQNFPRDPVAYAQAVSVVDAASKLLGQSAFMHRHARLAKSALQSIEQSGRRQFLKSHFEEVISLLKEMESASALGQISGRPIPQPMLFLKELKAGIP